MLVHIHGACGLTPPLSVILISYTNPKLKADKRLIFTLVRIPQGMQIYTEENCLYFSHLLGFPTLHAAGTGGINKVLGFI